MNGGFAKIPIELYDAYKKKADDYDFKIDELTKEHKDRVAFLSKAFFRSIIRLCSHELGNNQDLVNEAVTREGYTITYIDKEGHTSTVGRGGIKIEIKANELF